MNQLLLSCVIKKILISNSYTSMTSRIYQPDCEFPRQQKSQGAQYIYRVFKKIHPFLKIFLNLALIYSVMIENLK